MNAKTASNTTSLDAAIGSRPGRHLLERPRRPLRAPMAVPSFGLNSRFPLSEPTFAGPQGNAADAPYPVIQLTAFVGNRVGKQVLCGATVGRLCD